MKPFALKNVPWATMGRRESFSEISAKAEAEKSCVSLMPRQPMFSVVSTICDPNCPLVQSLRAQSYPYWELLVPETVIEKCEDQRIKGFSCGVSGAVFEIGRHHAGGEWVTYLDPTDILSPSALFTFANEIERNQTKDLFYCHEVHLSPDMSHVERFYSKSEYSWYNLIHFNCVGRIWMVRKSILEKLSVEPEFEPRKFEFGLFLKLSEETENWNLIPSYLCYRSNIRASSIPHTSHETSLIESHIKRKGFEGRVTKRDGHILVTPEIHEPNAHLISFVICFHNRSDWTIRCLEELDKINSRFPRQVIVVNNRSNAHDRALVFKAIARLSHPVEWVDDDRPFNFGQMHNDAVSGRARGDLLFFLNNDAFLSPRCDLDSMAAWALHEGVGVVGMRLNYPDGRVQHSGFRAIWGGQSRMARVGHEHVDSIFTGLRREVFGVTFAAALMRRKVYESLGGLRSVEFPNGFGDVAFNLECHRRGLHNLYLGDVTGIHHESGSRGLSYEYWEEVAIEREFCDILQKMLRADTGFNLIPKPEFSWQQIKEILLGTLYDKFPQLLTLRPKIKRLLSKIKNGFIWGKSPTTKPIPESA